VGELKVDVALAARPPFGPLEAAPDALWLLGERPDSLRRAYGEILAGHLPTSPALMWAAPSETDPTAAPAGKAVAWLSGFVPLRPASGEWTHQLEEQAAEHLLSGFAAITGTDLRDYAESVTITGPPAWGRRLGSATGTPNHLDLALDQLLGWRPPGMAGYRTPLGWLYLSGAGTHPGGGLTGVPGRNAALALLADLGGRRGPTGGRWRSLRAGIDLVRALRR
jgi:beta-carotene ketolase (CrtO type)